MFARIVGWRNWLILKWVIGMMMNELKRCSGCREGYFKCDVRCFRHILVTLYTCKDCEAYFSRFEGMVEFESWNDE